MAKSPNLLIDIGIQSIKVMQLRPVKDGVEIVKAGSEKLAVASNADQETLNAAIKETLPLLLQKLGIKENRAVVSIPGKAAFTRQIKIPVVRGKQLGRIIKYEAKQQIPFPLDQVNLDYEVNDAHGEIPELDVALVAVRKEVADGYAAALKKCGIRADVIDAAPLAIFNAYSASSKRDPNEVTAVVSIGASSTDIAIEQHGKMKFIRSATIAGNSLTALLQKKLGVSEEEAEKLKRKKAEEYDEDDARAAEVAAVLESGFDKIITEIRRSFDFYVSQPDSEPVTRIYLCGGTVNINGVNDFLEESLGVPVETFSVSDVSCVKISPDQERAIGLEAALIGLAVRSAGKATCALSFSPAHIKQRLELERRSPLLLSMLILIVAMIGGSYYFLNGLVQKQANAVNQMNQIVKPGQQTLEPLKVARDKQTEYKNRIERIDDVAVKRGELTRVFLEVQRLIPRDIWLDSIEWSYGKKALHGRALSYEGITTYLRDLTMSPYFNNNAVALTDQTFEPDPITGKTQATFEITIFEFKQPTEEEIKFVDEFRTLTSDITVLIIEFERANPEDPKSDATLICGCYDYEDNDGRLGFLRKVHTALQASGDTTVKKIDLRYHDLQGNLINHFVVTVEDVNAWASRQLTPDELLQKFEPFTPQPTPRPTDTPTPGAEDSDSMGAYGGYGGYGGMGMGGYGGMGMGAAAPPPAEGQ